MNNELIKKDIEFKKTERAFTERSETVNISNKGHGENSNINNNLKKDKHIKKNEQKISINFTNKKHSPFSKPMKDLNNTKELTSKYNKEEKKKTGEHIDKLCKSEMKDTKKEENSNNFTNDKIASRYIYSKEKKKFNTSCEKRSNDIYIRPINKKYLRSPEKKNKRLCEELDKKIHKEHFHNSNKRSLEGYYNETKSIHERKRYKNSPEIYDKRMNSRKRDVKIEALLERSQCNLNNKKERENNSKVSEKLSREKKNSFNNKEEPKFTCEKFDKNKENSNKRKFEYDENVLREKSKSHNKQSNINYNNYIDNDKLKNHKDIKISKELSNEKYAHKDNVNNHVNEEKYYGRDKRKEKSPDYNLNDKKCIKTEPKNFDENYQPCKNDKEYEIYKDRKDIEEKNVQKGISSNEDVDMSKKKVETKDIREYISENINENKYEKINESRNSTSDGKYTEKSKNENSSDKEDTVEECETPNEYSSDSEKNKVDCILNGCRSVKNYRKLNKISEGTYGTVFRAQNKKTKKIVALKQLKHFSSIRNEGFAITSLREINILLQLEHENILSIKEVVIGKNLNDIYLVMEYIEHELKILLDNKSPSFTISELKCLLKQLLSGINYLHTNWVMHRDLKPTNLLYSNRGILKICDFGMSRKFGHITIHNLTKNVVTLWYRAPELLLGEKCYTNKIDIWSVGCIFAEMILKKPLFIGDNEYEQIMKILSLLGLPDKESYPEFYEYTFISKNKDLFRKKKIKMNVNNIRSYFPNVANQFSGLYLSDSGVDLLQKLLHFNPKNRISAAEALNHPYFKEFPRPTEISEMPIIPDTNKVIRSSKMASHFNLLNQKNIQFHS
ncbi:cdc2-related protein kinase 1, putative [Plasmodium gallinaceum]|uniref:Cyclin-dependent kinase 2 homolog n=1 Tax=Plasmodium gallinaceum TaxID=5849 RepID=A0A1J1GLG6_PLAGA|nr:cdc2-related protein kinase 1, putative [Plasmodium gallinaceum]CRG93209.1 cdc2-related protein kinase 1, putative [Plasmodium gallinaceum]